MAVATKWVCSAAAAAGAETATETAAAAAAAVGSRRKRTTFYRPFGRFNFSATHLKISHARHLGMADDVEVGTGDRTPYCKPPSLTRV